MYHFSIQKLKGEQTYVKRLFLFSLLFITSTALIGCDFGGVSTEYELVGPAQMTLEVGDTYVEQGTTYTPASAVVITGAVDTNTIGTYTIEYAIPLQNNATLTLTRFVDVVDTTLPIITMIGTDMNLEVGATFTDPGATAQDNYDGDISTDIVVSGVVDVNTVGTYLINYDVSDSSLNAATTVTRTVTITAVQTNNPPVITLNGGNTISLFVGNTFVDPGAIALDDEDGDISDNIIVTGTVDTNTVGSYTITYTITDSNNNTVYVQRIVDIEENESPEIFPNSVNPTIYVGDQYNEDGAIAQDLEDGDISNLIVITGTVDTTTAGVYTITYCVTDSGGATTCVDNFVSVILIGDEEPTLDLIGPSLILHVIGDTYTEQGATAIDQEDGDISDQIVIDDSFVEWTVEGFYSILYTIQDSGGHFKLIERVIHVIPVGYDYPPVITLLGNQHMILTIGSTFIDPGATALDTEDGDLSLSIIVNGMVDTSVEGYNEITYQVTDSFGNTTETTRLVEVVQNQQPILYVNNLNPILVMGDMYIEQGATAEDYEDGDLTSLIVITGTVNSFMLGQYQVTYSVTDSAGATVTIVSIVTVTGPNNTAPELTLIGPSHITFVIGDVYVELGATAIDTEEGDLSGQIVIDYSQVDWNHEGNYQISYYVQDLGFLSDTIYRYIDIYPVGSDLPPVLTLNGQQNITILLNSTYTEQGATAIDPEDGDITLSIIVNGTVNTSIVGEYIIQYQVTDSHGNTVTIERSVEVRKDDPPVIDPVDWFPVYYVGDTYFEAGATAWDEEDGDITAQIITSGTVDTSTIGQYTITYQVTDSAGNTVTFDNIVTVTTLGNTAPVITLIGSQNIQLIVGSSYTELGATALDAEDGDITVNIIIDDSQVDWNMPGYYVIMYKVTDSESLYTEEYRYISISNTGTDLDPVLTLIGLDEIYLSVGDTYIEQGATALDPEDGDISANIVIDSSALDMNIAGYYNISYFIEDSAGNQVQIWRLVIVEAVGYDAPPSITLIGGASINLAQGDTYTELGATAIDLEDGNITSSIIISGTVDTSTPGNYQVTYEVTDSFGNTVWVYRYVTVNENQCPTLFYIDIFPYVTLGDTYVYPGMTAYDFEDGNITANIVTTGTYDTNTLGNYIMFHTITDSQGCSMTIANIISVINTTSYPPNIDLIGGDMQYQIHIGDTYIEFGATAHDLEDGDITNDIIIVDTYVDWATPGQYFIWYFVFDSDYHYAHTIRIIEILEAGVDALPILALNNDCFVRVPVGGKFIDPGYSAWDSEDGDLTSSVIVTGHVDTNTLGIYDLVYEVTDSYGHTVYEYLTVFVE